MRTNAHEHGHEPNPAAAAEAAPLDSTHRRGGGKWRNFAGQAPVESASSAATRDGAGLDSVSECVRVCVYVVMV